MKSLITFQQLQLGIESNFRKFWELWQFLSILAFLAPKWVEFSENEIFDHFPAIAAWNWVKFSEILRTLTILINFGVLGTKVSRFFWNWKLWSFSNILSLELSQISEILRTLTILVNFGVFSTKVSRIFWKWKLWSLSSNYSLELSQIFGNFENFDNSCLFWRF